jgi:GDP-L-fucose synthase
MLWQLLRKEAVPLVSFVPEEEYSIKELALEIAKIYNIESQITFDTTKADGQFKKTMGN